MKILLLPFWSCKKIWKLLEPRSKFLRNRANRTSILNRRRIFVWFHKTLLMHLVLRVWQKISCFSRVGAAGNSPDIALAGTSLWKNRSPPKVSNRQFKKLISAKHNFFLRVKTCESNNDSWIIINMQFDVMSSARGRGSLGQVRVRKIVLLTHEI